MGWQQNIKSRLTPTLPPYGQLVIGNDGRITIEPLDGEPGQRGELGS